MDGLKISKETLEMQAYVRIWYKYAGFEISRFFFFFPGVIGV
jgi:hypothetical protein